MFDFGASTMTLHNAQKLGIDIGTADYMVCSHSHYDHAAGYADVIRCGFAKDLVTGRGFWNEKYAFNGTKYTYLGAGFGLNILEKNGISNNVCGEIMKIAEGCYVVGDFERKFQFETIPERFVNYCDGKFVKDDFGDEVCMVLDSPKGLVVLVGCSHPGILNILDTVSHRLDRKIAAVFGGTHLMEADDERINFTLSEMKKMGIDILGFSHCSGEQVRNAVRSDADLKGCHLAAGDVFIL
jgi:7,8-dihydropterin-6-yl-methyl-4-(beta-D-ribofuranosyl)aminobenzene 5'-phosphate synthase